METALNEFVSWADSNYLTINYSKTNKTIERVKTCRYLCFIVDENVSWKEHAKLVGNKL